VQVAKILSNQGRRTRPRLNSESSCDDVDISVEGFVTLVVQGMMALRKRSEKLLLISEIMQNGRASHLGFGRANRLSQGAPDGQSQGILTAQLKDRLLLDENDDTAKDIVENSIRRWLGI